MSPGPPAPRPSRRRRDGTPMASVVGTRTPRPLWHGRRARTLPVMAQYERSPSSGRDENSLAAQAQAELREQLAQVREQVIRTRDETLRITGDIAETERQLAATLRRLADSARTQGRPRDAARLDREADDAQSFAASEEQRA